MACYHPLAACLISTPSGKVISFDRRAKGQVLSLPCGRCIGCKLEKARQWAVRIMHERQVPAEGVSDACCFCTLTFSKEAIPKDGSLDVRTFQLFMKRLRARISTKEKPVRTRFFMCAEYGELCASCGKGRSGSRRCFCVKPVWVLGRPHYHFILFGFDFPDRVVLKADATHALYRSDLLDDVWGQGWGSIGEVSFDSAMYVANYATKKINGRKAAAWYTGRRPEFLTMSRMPGIGSAWIAKYSGEVFPEDEVIVKGLPARPPRFYSQYLESIDPELFEEIRTKRGLAAESLTEEVRILRRVTKSIDPCRNAKRLLVRETVALAKVNLKSRNLET